MNSGYFKSFGIFTENQLLEFENDIVHCLETLRKGGIILYPTDTIWGIGCDATNPDAVEKIFELKQRPAAKSMIVLLADPRDINRYTSHPQPYIAEYLEKATNPTTVIYEGGPGPCREPGGRRWIHCHAYCAGGFLQASDKKIPETACFHFCKYFRTGCTGKFYRNIPMK